jgi:hypothetical protein
MKKFLPSSIHEVVKGLIMVIIAMFLMRFIPAGIKAKLLGSPVA